MTCENQQRFETLEHRVQDLTRQLRFVMQTLSLTCQLPNGQTDSRSLAVLYKEMTAHAGPTPQTFADVARRAFGSDAASGQPAHPDIDTRTTQPTRGRDDDAHGHPVESV
jgi:hypothetical protein